MAEQLSTPRITAPYLDNFVGRVVMLVGKVTQLRGDQATLDADGTVTVLLNRVSITPEAHALSVPPRIMHDMGKLIAPPGSPSRQWEWRAGHRKGEPGPVDQGPDVPRPWDRRR